MNRTSKHMGLGLALGAALGTVFGVVAGHVGAWLAAGVAIGMLLGASLFLKEPRCPECAAMHRMHGARPKWLAGVEQEVPIRHPPSGRLLRAGSRLR